MIIINVIVENAMTILTGITAIVLVFYTGETYRLRKESQKQTLKSFTPYLVLHSFDRHIHLLNLGQGIAKQVTFNPDYKINERAILNIVAVAPGAEEELLVPDMDDSGAWSVDYLFLPADKICFTYFDILGNKYIAMYKKSFNHRGGFTEISQTRVGEY